MTDRYHDTSVADQESSHDMACKKCAVSNGHTIEDAENCDNGDVGCPDCVFNKEREND